MPRSPTNWKEVAAGKTPTALAEFLLADLTGYRSTSLHRADDTTAVYHLILAITGMQPTDRFSMRGNPAHEN